MDNYLHKCIVTFVLTYLRKSQVLQQEIQQKVKWNGADQGYVRMHKMYTYYMSGTLWLGE